jgi:hypothetical protein
LRYDDSFIDWIRVAEAPTTCNAGGTLRIVLDLKVKQSFSFNIEGWIKDRYENVLYFFSEGHSRKKVHEVEGDTTIRFTTAVNLPYMGEGTYLLQFALSEPNKATFAGMESPIPFEIILCDPYGTGFSMKYDQTHRGKSFIESHSSAERIG